MNVITTSKNYLLDTGYKDKEDLKDMTDLQVMATASTRYNMRAFYPNSKPHHEKYATRLKVEQKIARKYLLKEGFGEKELGSLRLLRELNLYETRKRINKLI